MDFFDCLELPHMTLEELDSWDDYNARPVFLVGNWIGDIHYANWNLYRGKSANGHYLISQNNINAWNDNLYRKDNYEKKWIAFKDKPDCIDFKN